MLDAVPTQIALHTDPPPIELPLNSARAAPVLPTTNTSNSLIVGATGLNNNSTVGGLIIEQPGSYIVRSNLTYSPLNTDTAAIVINADNVMLDLGGSLIEQGNSTASTDGIRVIQGHRNIVIYRGTIANFTGNGISFPDDGSDTPTQVFMVANILIDSCQQYGINFGTRTGIATINDIAINGNSVTDAGYKYNGYNSGFRHSFCIATKCTYGIHMSGSNNTTMAFSNCAFLNNTSSAGVAAGAYLVGGKGIIFHTCHFMFNSSSADSAYGLYANNCANLVFRHSAAAGNYTTAAGKTAAGFYCDATSSGMFIDCEARSNTTVNPDTATLSQAIGYALNNSSAWQFYEAEAVAQQSTGAAYGFSITGNSSSILISECHASGNKSTGTVNGCDAIGFYLNGLNASTCCDCIADTQSTAAYSSGSQSTLAVGFYSISGRSNKFTDCQALNNDTGGNYTSTSDYALAAGFLFEGTEATVVSECAATGNKATYDNTACGRSAGFILRPNGMTNPKNCIVKECKASDNVSVNDPGGRSVGFWDATSSASSTTFFTGNTAYGQGACATPLDPDAGNSVNFYWKLTTPANWSKVVVEMGSDSLSDFVTVAQSNNFMNFSITPA